jgi:hypothetical protein
VSEIVIDLTEPPIQSLMNYVFENYRKLKGFCEIEGKSKNAVDCGNCHRNSYFGRGSPKYACDNFRRVYLLRYLARQFAQSDLVVREHVLREFENKKDLSAVSLGGGPAPEALALLDGLSSCKGDYSLFFNNVESEASWESIFHDISHQFAGYAKNVKLKTAFSCYDATGYAPQKQHDHDIVFISWLFSDIRGGDNAGVLRLAGDLVTPQGYILVMDRYENSLVSRISDLIDATQGLTLVKHETEHVHSVVDFPQDIVETFGPDFGCDFAYWVLQS